MKRHHPLAVIVAFGLLVLAAVLFVPLAGAKPTAASTHGTFSTIDYPGSPYTVPLGVNDLGVITGAYTGTDGNPHGFLYRGGHYATIDYPGAATDFAGDVNDLGVIVGAYAYTHPGGVYHGFIDRGGQYTTINDPNAGTGPGQGTFPQGVNNLGEVTGLYVDSTGHAHGFTYLYGTFTTIDAPGATDTYLVYPNDFGAVAGFSFDSSGNHSFVFQRGAWTTISDPVAPAGQTFAGSVNDLGTVVGTYYDSGGLAHGFFERGGHYTTFDDSSAGTDGSQGQGTFPNSSNNLGLIVGYYTDGSNVTHGFELTGY